MSAGTHTNGNMPSYNLVPASDCGFSFWNGSPHHGPHHCAVQRVAGGFDRCIRRRLCKKTHSVLCVQRTSNSRIYVIFRSTGSPSQQFAALNNVPAPTPMPPNCDYACRTYSDGGIVPHTTYAAHLRIHVHGNGRMSHRHISISKRSGLCEGMKGAPMHNRARVTA